MGLLLYAAAATMSANPGPAKFQFLFVQVPTAFRGRWAQTTARCRQPSNVVTIDANAMRNFDRLGEMRAVRIEEGRVTFRTTTSTPAVSVVAARADARLTITRDTRTTNLVRCP